MTIPVRDQTRKQRYQTKADSAIKSLIGIASMNLGVDENIGFLARTVACFGGNSLHVIGRLPDNATLQKYSGSMSSFVKIHSYSNPFEFLHYIRQNNIYLVSTELTDKSVDIRDATLDFSRQTLIVVGHETAGIPVEILQASDLVVQIPMPGIGFCLNTSQAANIMMYHFTMRYLDSLHAE